MQPIRIVPTATLIAMLSAPATIAGEVSVEGVHICCGVCIRALTAALADVEGVSNAEFDRDNQSLSFSAHDARAANRGMRAILDAGFGGQFTHEGKQLTPPLPKIDAGTKANRFVITGVHLCCSWCFEDAVGSLEDVDGVTKAAIPQRRKKMPQKTIIVTGKNIDLRETRRALLGAGLYGKLEIKPR